jgi:hypothetical protein
MGRQYNIKTDLKEIGCEGMDWINFARERVQLTVLVNKAMDFRVQNKRSDFLSHKRL